MNYTNQLLENKLFNNIKLFLYNLAVTVCIILSGVLILVYCFKINLYTVQSDSQAPVFATGDLVVVKQQTNYQAGDIIQFTHNNIPTTHRLVYIHTENDNIYYICHGDNVETINPKSTQQIVSWQEEAEYIKEFLNNKSIKELNKDIRVQIISFSQIEGKVIAHIGTVGYVFTFIKENYLLCLSVVLAVWCFSYVIKNEIEIKRSFRLL